VPLLNLELLSKDEIREMALIELAYEILTARKQSINFRDLLEQIAELNGVQVDDLRSRISQFYTDLNVDGRFLCVGENQWGLRLWYPFDQSEDEIIVVPKVKKKKAKKAVLEDDFEDIDEIAENEFILGDEEEDEELFDDIDDLETFEEEEFIEDVIDTDLDVDVVDDLDEDLIEDELPLELEEEIEEEDEDDDLLDDSQED
jgi:DNA-directed RNA polymerase subunit delta